MQARGPLMIEHRLIERMLSVIEDALPQIEARQEVDSAFVDTVVDFIRIYADKTHHGKEEDILFRELDNKQLNAEDRKILQELIEEHKFGRKITKALVDANTSYKEGDNTVLKEIIAKLKVLIDFYPRHIEKEDKVFFPSSRSYFTDEEEQAMLEDFWEFDQKMIHEKYNSVVRKLEDQ